MSERWEEVMYCTRFMTLPSASLSFSTFSQINLLDVLVVSVFLAKIIWSHSTRRLCQNHIVFKSVSFCGNMQWCWSLCTVSVHNEHILVHYMQCSARFPSSIGMFKGSSCAVRICLSLFSKNTCSAFYQRTELARHGSVQGWAQIIKHQRIQIYPDRLGLFAGLVWLGLAGHGERIVMSAVDWCY